MRPFIEKKDPKIQESRFSIQSQWRKTQIFPFAGQKETQKLSFGRTRCPLWLSTWVPTTSPTTSPRSSSGLSTKEKTQPITSVSARSPYGRCSTNNSQRIPWALPLGTKKSTWKIGKYSWTKRSTAIRSTSELVNCKLTSKTKSSSSRPSTVRGLRRGSSTCGRQPWTSTSRAIARQFMSYGNILNKSTFFSKRSCKRTT